MGSPFTIIFYTADTTTAMQASRICYQLADSLIGILSDYIDSSELNRLCASAGTNTDFKCSPVLFQILLQSKFAFENSNGSFDITLGPVTRLWRKARKEKTFPDSALVKAKMALTGFTKVQLDTVMHTAKLSQAGMQLDLGGIGQGFIAQQVIHRLQSLQINNALADVSGDIVCIGSPPGRQGWTIAVNLPESEHELLTRPLLISNAAVTTSGDVYQYVLFNGKRYSHIVDPATGFGITTQRNVTVVAADGSTADWLTKACSILSLHNAVKLANKLQAAVLIAELKQGKLVLHASNRFKKYWKRNSAAQAVRPQHSEH